MSYPTFPFNADVKIFRTIIAAIAVGYLPTIIGDFPSIAAGEVASINICKEQLFFRTVMRIDL